MWLSSKGLKTRISIKRITDDNCRLKKWEELNKNG